MTVKLNTNPIPAFIHNRYSTEYQPKDSATPDNPLVAIYLLRLAIALKKRMTLQDLRGLFTGGLAKYTRLTEQQGEIPATLETDEINGLDDNSNQQTCSITKAKLMKAIRSRLRQLIKQGIPANESFFTNLSILAKALGLTETDQEIVVISALMDAHTDFRDFLNLHWPDISVNGLRDYLHLLTVRPVADIETSLDPNSPLRKLGLLSPDPLALYLSERLALLDALPNILWHKYDSVDSMMDTYSKPIEKNVLTLHPEAHLKADLDVLVPYLQAALATKQAGVNILVHAGAGKETIEWVNAVTHHLGAALVRIDDHWPNGSSIMTPLRFSGCQFVQACLSTQTGNQLILMDAAETIFTDNDDYEFLNDDDNRNSIDESSLAKQLQTNPVPIFWVFNKAVRIKPELFEHFSYTWKIDNIPVSLRTQLIEHATEGLIVSQEWINHLARQTDIKLEEINNAAAVARTTGQTSAANSEKLMLNTLNAKRRLFKQVPIQGMVKHHTGYDLKFTNTSIQLPALIAGLRHSPRGNFCFYGAPGTGKTAFANHIADQLGMTLLIKRASDLMDKYVGESEKNIARMFAEAQQQDAILLLDEADSMLSDRRDAHRSWEISQVNEMLTQMERFSGIFICTTNLMEKLDAASLRRFDFKVKFDYLGPEQRWELFVQEAQRMGSDLPSDDEALTKLRQKVQRLTQLTPGDFAVANRQATLLGRSLTPDHMFAVLAQECEAKGERFGRIGFVH